MSAVDIGASDLARLRSLIDFLRTVPRHTDASIAAIRDARAMRRISHNLEMDRLAIEQGREPTFEIILPKLRGVPVFPAGTTNGRDAVRPHDNDLPYHCELVRAAIEEYRDDAYTPAPHYARRIAIIVRKARQFELEVDFLVECTKFYGDPWFRAREPKARELATKRAPVLMAT